MNIWFRRGIACSLITMLSLNGFGCKPRQRSKLRSMEDSRGGTSNLVEALSIEKQLNASPTDLMSGEKSKDPHAFIDRLEKLVDSTKEQDIRDEIGQILIKAYFDAQGAGWAQDMDNSIRQLYSQCQTFEGCMRKLRHLSFVLPFSPLSLDGNGSGSDVIATLLTSAEGVLKGSPLLANIVKERAEALRSVVFMYSKAGFNSKENLGRIPFIKNPQDLNSLRQRLQTSKQNHFKLLEINADQVNQDTESMINDINHQVKWYNRVLAELIPHYQRVDPEYTAFLRDNVDKKVRTQYLIKRASAIYFELYKGLRGVQVLQLYTERLSNRNPSNWLNNITANTLQDPVLADIVMECLQQFSYFELKLGSGADWVNVMKTLSLQNSGKGWDFVVQAAERQHETLMKFHNDTAKVLGITDPPQQIITPRRELAMIDSFGGTYESYDYQWKRFFAAASDITQARSGWKDESHPSSDELEKIKVKSFEVSVRQGSLICYLALKQFQDGDYVAWTFKFFGDPSKEINPLDVCLYGYNTDEQRRNAMAQMKSGNLSPGTPVVNYLTAKKVKEAWLPVIVDGVFTIISAPILIAAGIPTGGAATVAGKQLAQETIKFSLKRLATRQFLKWSVKGFVLKYFESCVFTASMRVLYAGASNIVGFATDTPEMMGGKIIYDSNKSFAANVGAFAYDSLVGVPFIMFLPGFSTAGHKVNELILSKAPNLVKGTLGTELIAVTTDVASNFAGMLTIGKAVTFVETEFSKNSHLAGHHWEKEAYLALAFSLVHRRGNKVHSEKESELEISLQDYANLENALVNYLGK